MVATSWCLQVVLGPVFGVGLAFRRLGLRKVQVESTHDSVEHKNEEGCEKLEQSWQPTKEDLFSKKGIHVGQLRKKGGTIGANTDDPVSVSALCVVFVEAVGRSERQIDITHPIPITKGLFPAWLAS